MAASKIHLANTDKNYKLKKTDKLTTEGKPIYVNSLTGEEHSEISVTIEYPANSGKWINVPSLKNGRVYNPKGVLAMLKAGKLTPTSTHMSEQEAVEAAVYRSTTLQSNTGETLKPSNDINLLTSQSARITEQEVPGLIAEVNRAEDAFQNQETGFPEPRVTRADVPAYTSGSGANADILAAAEAALASDQQTQRLGAIMDNQALEKQDDYYKYYPNSARNTDPNFSGTAQPERISERATQYLEPEGSARAARERAIGRTMESYGNRTGGVNPLDSNTMLAEGSSNGRGINYSRESISPFNNMVDLSNIENLTDNGAPGSAFAIAKENQRQNDKIDEIANASDKAAMQQRKKRLIAEERAKDLERLNNSIGPIISQLEETKGINVDSKGYSIGVNIHEGEPVPSGTPITAEAISEAFPGNENASFDSNTVYDMGASDDGIFPDVIKKAKNLNPDKQMQNSYNSIPGMMSDGPSTRGRNRQKPIFNFSMRPEEKMNDARSLKGLTPDYGEMPGFKKAKDGNYWSADENSEFWKTDAGYEKAVQTWGASGNPLPTYVKKPARKELDVQAIKNFFKPNR